MGYTVSPLRYPGGKYRLARFIESVVERNDLSGGHYVEPYAGGAGIACKLLLDGRVAHVHINDIDASISAFWHSLLEETDGLCRLIHDTPIDMETWYRQREIQRVPEAHAPLTLGFSTFFLNRTNRSGIIRGGVIGGLCQNGGLRLNARFNKRKLIAKIQRIAAKKSAVTLYNMDAADFIMRILPNLPQSSLVYLDPPYYGKGKELYPNYYQHQDHVRIARLVKRHIRQNWIVTYDDVPAIRALYNPQRRRVYRLSYTAATRYFGAEIMFVSQSLVIPRGANPIPVPARY